ncbi:uncharacterized protein LOC142524050 isoform X2 [Primulina tabacum]|uniref:uncharacterized protein LOC142524050 isoform X2 n=1 Tax=Primulina tabacum TaxID=48773 RepID=UPI003F5A81F6
MMSCVCKPPPPLYLRLSNFSCTLRFSQPHRLPRFPLAFIGILCSARGTSRLRSNSDLNNQTETVGIQLYRDNDGLLTETVKQSRGGWGASGDWSEIEGAWVLRPKTSKVTSIVHFVGGIFVGAAPQLTYRLFLKRLADRGILFIATPFASGFDHFLIADELQFKFERWKISLLLALGIHWDLWFIFS